MNDLNISLAEEDQKAVVVVLEIKLLLKEKKNLMY